MYFTQMLFLHRRAHDKEGTPHPKRDFQASVFILQ